MKLFISAVTKTLLGLLLVGLLIFLPAGSIDYFGGWLFISLLFVPMLILGVFLFIKSPDLLKKRLDGKEKQLTQKGVVALSGLVFVGGFVLSGVDYRLNWSHVPTSVTVITSILFLAIPLILGSWWAFAIFCVYPFIIAVRIKDEEKLLTNELDGYAEYKNKVKYRLIPFIW